MLSSSERVGGGRGRQTRRRASRLRIVLSHAAHGRGPALSWLAVPALHGSNSLPPQRPRRCRRRRARADGFRSPPRNSSRGSSRPLSSPPGVPARGSASARAKLSWRCTAAPCMHPARLHQAAFAHAASRIWTSWGAALENSSVSWTSLLAGRRDDLLLGVSCVARLGSMSLLRASRQASRGELGSLACASSESARRLSKLPARGQARVAEKGRQGARAQFRGAAKKSARVGIAGGCPKEDVVW